jgi:predicted amidohydrolase
MFRDVLYSRDHRSWFRNHELASRPRQVSRCSCESFVSEIRTANRRLTGYTRMSLQVYEGGGFTAIYGPEGTKLAQAKDQFSEEIVTADLDMDQIHLHKQMADCIGH